MKLQFQKTVSIQLKAKASEVVLSYFPSPDFDPVGGFEVVGEALDVEVVEDLPQKAAASEPDRANPRIFPTGSVRKNCNERSRALHNLETHANCMLYTATHNYCFQEKITSVDADGLQSTGRATQD